jgi:hypothetical protein
VRVWLPLLWFLYDSNAGQCSAEEEREVCSFSLDSHVMLVAQTTIQNIQ